MSNLEKLHHHLEKARRKAGALREFHLSPRLINKYARIERDLTMMIGEIKEER